jgi:hypothetical protein
MKEARKRQRNCLDTCTGFIVQSRALWRGTPARELEPTAAYRLGIHIGEWPGGETPLGGKILREWSQPSLGEARGDKW